MGEYHLPDGETLVTDLQCLVVYTPADAVYRQALWGAISQLTKYWMWQPDGQGGEHDAADSWDIAYAATLESFGMLEELLQSVDEVEPLLRQLQVQQMCCDQLPGADEIIAESESDGATSATDVGGGVFPPGIANEGEWDGYICNAATALIDRLIEAPDYLTQFASLSISLVTAVAVWYIAGAYIAIAGTIGGILTRLDIFDIIDLFENLVAGIDGETEDPPGQVATKLLAIRDDLICDIVQANDADAAASAVNTRIGGTTISTAWKNIFQLFFTNQFIMAKVFEHEAEEAPTASCSCQINCDSLADLPAGYSCFVAQLSTVTGTSNCGTPDAFTIHQLEQIGDEVFVDIEIDDTSGCASRGQFHVEMVANQGSIDGYLMYPTSGITIIGEAGNSPSFSAPAADIYHEAFTQAEMDSLDSGVPVGGTVQSSGALFDWMEANYVRAGSSDIDLNDKRMAFKINNPTSGSTRFQFSFIPFAITS